MDNIVMNISIERSMDNIWKWIIDPPELVQVITHLGLILQKKVMTQNNDLQTILSRTAISSGPLPKLAMICTSPMPLRMQQEDFNK